jgi:hypothetical protein
MQLNIATEKSLQVTYGVLATAFVFLFALGVWVTSIEMRASTNEEKIIIIEQEYKKVGDGIVSIDKRLYRIEVLLEQTKKGNKNE